MRLLGNHRPFDSGGDRRAGPARGGPNPRASLFCSFGAACETAYSFPCLRSPPETSWKSKHYSVPLSGLSRKNRAGREGKTAVTTIPCGVAVIRRGREFLIAQRLAHDTLGSFWEFPGGKRRPGESFKDCIRREILEELGIQIEVQGKLIDVRSRYRGKVIWLNFYFCRHLSGDPRPLECQQVVWADVEALKNYRFPPANEEVIRLLVRQYA